MLKKITLVTLFVVSVAVGASSTVFGHLAMKAPVASTSHGFCWPPGMPGCVPALGNISSEAWTAPVPDVTRFGQ